MFCSTFMSVIQCPSSVFTPSHTHTHTHTCEIHFGFSSFLFPLRLPLPVQSNSINFLYFVVPLNHVSFTIELPTFWTWSSMPVSQRFVGAPVKGCSLSCGRWHETWLAESVPSPCRICMKSCRCLQLQGVQNNYRCFMEFIHSLGILRSFHLPNVNIKILRTNFSVVLKII